MTITSPIWDYKSAEDPSMDLHAQQNFIDDQILPGYGKCYGAFYAAKLKTTNGNLAVINIDSYVYFALVSPASPATWIR